MPGGLFSMNYTVYQLPRRDPCEHIWLLVVVKKQLWKSMRRLLPQKGPLTCNPRYILSTLLYRKAVENKDYQHVTIPNPRDIERITSNLNEQVMALLENAFFSDSMIADRLLQRQRTEVEDQQEGLNNIGCDEVILKGVLLTEVPGVANPMAHVLESLTNKLDVAAQESDVDNKSLDIEFSRDVSGIRDSAEVKGSQGPC